MPRAPQRPNPHARPLRTQAHPLDCFKTSGEYRADLAFYHVLHALDMLLARQPGDLNWSTVFPATIRRDALTFGDHIGLGADLTRIMNEMTDEIDMMMRPDPYDPE